MAGDVSRSKDTASQIPTYLRDNVIKEKNNLPHGSDALFCSKPSNYFPSSSIKVEVLTIAWGGMWDSYAIRQPCFLNSPPLLLPVLITWSSFWTCTGIGLD